MNSRQMPDYSRIRFKPRIFNRADPIIDGDLKKSEIAPANPIDLGALREYVGKRILTTILSGARDIESVRRNAEALIRAVMAARGIISMQLRESESVSVDAALRRSTLQIPPGFRSNLGCNRSALGESLLLGDRTLESFAFIRLTITIPRALYERIEQDNATIILLRESMEQAMPLHLDCELSFEVLESERTFVLRTAGRSKAAILGVTTMLNPM